MQVAACVAVGRVKEFAPDVVAEVVCAMLAVVVPVIVTSVAFAVVAPVAAAVACATNWRPVDMELELPRNVSKHL
jgi:hypothetical protein